MGSSSARRREQQERASRAATLRREQQAKERRRLLLTGAAVVAVLAVIASIAIAALAGRDDDADVALTGVQSFTVEARTHTTDPVTYPQTPPVGGPHDPRWLNCGVYDEPVRNENAVHDLEHGAVWITYAPNLPAGQVDALKRLALSRTYVTLSPYPGLPAPVVASAWGKQLRLTGADDPRLARFLTEYVQGPQTPEPGAPCTGGVGTPTS